MVGNAGSAEMPRADAPHTDAGLPSAGQYRSAVATYLKQAYPDGAVPPAIMSRTRFLDGVPDDQPVPASAFERTKCGERCSYVLRLGQAQYPHMKLVLEPAPGEETLLYRVDAHDSHLHAPAGSPDAAPLAVLRAHNQQVVERIEHIWDESGVPTFRAYLRATLCARRRGAAEHGNT